MLKKSLFFLHAQAPAYYNYNWAVKDDPSYNNYGQTESRNGDKTEGSYFGELLETWTKMFSEK